jgi:hypothetical protein
MLVDVFKRIQTGLTSKDTGSPIEGRVREDQGREPRKGMVTKAVPASGARRQREQWEARVAGRWGNQSTSRVLRREVCTDSGPGTCGAPGHRTPRTPAMD